MSHSYLGLSGPVRGFFSSSSSIPSSYPRQSAFIRGRFVLIRAIRVHLWLLFLRGRGRRDGSTLLIEPRACDHLPLRPVVHRVAPALPQARRPERPVLPQRVHRHVELRPALLIQVPLLLRPV